MDVKKIEAWANKLLDVGKRNNLINFKDSKTSTLEVVHPDIEAVFAKAESSYEYEVFNPKLLETEEEDETVEEAAVREAIEEAVETGNYCEKIGVDRVSCCPATIHKGTLIERLWRRGAYNPPWIWSTVEVINRIRENIDIPSFMDTSGFGSRRGPYNCKKCNKELKHKIIDSNLDQSQIQHECECKSDWLADVKFSELNNSKTTIKHLPLY